MGPGRIGVARVVATAVAIGLGLFGFGSTALASGGHIRGGPGTAQMTTLDACGYFYGMQTAVEGLTTTSGSSSTTSDKGTWTGVWNNYSNTLVASLGTVKGSFSETFTEDTIGNLSGTEMFQSNAGSISQSYTFSTITGWAVTVSATRELSFLTSDTSGHCYTGPFPRP